MGKYGLEDKEFGFIVVSTRRGMKNVRTCVKKGVIEMHVPPGIGYDELRRVVEQNRERLRLMLARAEKNGLRYKVGDVVRCLDGSSIVIGVQSLCPSKALIGECTDGNFYVNISQEMDFSDENVINLISRCLKSIAKRKADAVIIGMAQETMAEIGVKHCRFIIGSGLRKLGHCTPKGEIQLSYNLMFLPRHLARFVILHELAHLTHFNHGSEFHDLLNRYCGGNERLWNAELKHFNWPVRM